MKHKLKIKWQSNGNSYILAIKWQSNGNQMAIHIFWHTPWYVNRHLNLTLNVKFKVDVKSALSFIFKLILKKKTMLDYQNIQQHLEH